MNASILWPNAFRPFIPSRNIQELFEDLAIKLGIPNPYDAAEDTISRIEDILETKRSYR